MPSQRPEPTAAADTLETSAAPAPASNLPAGHYAAIVESSDDAILSKDRRGIITSWNRGAQRVYGYSPEEAIGKPISILIPSHRRGEEMRILDRVLAGQRVDHYETERVTKDGRQIIVSLSLSPVRDEHGQIVSASVIARDITAFRRSQELATRLQELTAALAKEITPARTIDVLLTQAVAALGAGAGAVGLLEPEGREIELAGSAGYSEAGLNGWDRFPLDADTPMSLAIRTGSPVWTSSVAELKARFPLFSDAAISFQSLSVIPLALEGRPFGAIALSFESERHFDTEEQAFLVAAAQQAAYTLDRARLFEAERLSRERWTFLAEASELLSGSLDRDATLSGVADLAVNRIADWCGIEMVDDEGELHSVAVAHRDPDKVRLALDLRERYPVDPAAEQGVPNVVRTGLPELHPEIGEEMLAEAAEDEEHLRLLRELGLTSAMVVPLEVRGQTLGAITFVSSEAGRVYDEADLGFAQELARRAAVAIENATLFHREHDAAVTLQRALLPQALPELDGIEFAVRYEPAAPGLEVGGDWYEVVVRDDGKLAVIIGDVAGRGIRAASVMGRVRPALRAYVLDGYSPAESIERLDRLMRESENAEMTTVMHLQLDVGTGAAEYVRAGHPPGLLRLPTGEVVELSGAGTPPLGILSGVEYRTHTLEVPPGSLLLLYTDGLIERRDNDLDTGLRRLKEALAEAPASAEACLDWLADRFGAEAVPDDVAMVAVAT